MHLSAPAMQPKSPWNSTNASSKPAATPANVVLDIFAGCATTAVAAEKLERRWIACDMAYRAWTMLKRRFYLNGIALEG